MKGANAMDRITPDRLEAVRESAGYLAARQTWEVLPVESPFDVTDDDHLIGYTQGFTAALSLADEARAELAEFKAERDELAALVAEIGAEVYDREEEAPGGRRCYYIPTISFDEDGILVGRLKSAAARIAAKK